jgi:Zn finger protein HypA/HybF involved in hydrogenase expression
MHEARAVSAAVEHALADVPAPEAVSTLRLEVHDPTRASAEAVRFYAAAILRERGLESVEVHVETLAMTCELCGAAALPTVTNPLCDACGAPMRRLPGPAVEGHAESELR